MTAYAPQTPTASYQKAASQGLRGVALAVALLAAITAFAPVAQSGSSSASGSLTVSFTIRPSMLMSLHANNGEDLMGKGEAEASVTLPIQITSTSTSENGDVVSEMPISVMSRVANAGATSGYSLSATLMGAAGWTVEIDGNPVQKVTSADITMAKAIGDPYGTPVSHLIRVIRPKGSSAPGTPTFLVLKASPKSI